MVKSGIISEWDVMNVWRLLEVVRVGWQWFVGGAVAGLVGAIVFVLMTPAKYEAVAVFKAATITWIAVDSGLEQHEVEPISQSMERLKLVTFYGDEVVKSCQAPAPEAMVGNLSLNLIKGNKLLEIRYLAGSPELAKTCLLAIVEKLVKEQQVLAEPAIKALENGLNSARRQPHPLLAGPLTKRAELLEPVYASQVAIFPNKKMVIMGGFFGGLVVGGLMLYVRRGWLSNQSRIDSNV